MSHLIRPFDVADLEAVVAFSLEAWAPVYASFEAALGPTVYALLFPDWRSSEGAAIRATCTNPQHDVWVAVVDDRPVGFVAVGLVDEDAARAGEIHMIAVDPAHQGAGVGVALMEPGDRLDRGPGRRPRGRLDGRRPGARARPRPLREARLQLPAHGALLPDAAALTPVRNR